MRYGSVSRIFLSILGFLVIATLTRGGDGRLSGVDAPDTTRTVGQFGGATSFTVSPSGMFYILLGESDELLRLTPAGGVDRKVGGYGWSGSALDGPADVAVPSDLEVYIADYGNDRIVKLDRTLGIATVFETAGENVTFRFPLSVCVTGFGRVLVLDGEFGRIVEIDRDNRVTRLFGGRGTGPGALDHPVRVRTDGDSLIAVQDKSGILFYDLYGNFLRTIGRGLTGGYSRFAFRNGLLALLDTATVRFFTVQGEPAGVLNLPPGAQGGKGAFLDIDFDADRTYLLTDDGVRILDRRRSGGRE